MAGDYTKFTRHYGALTNDVDITALTPDPSTLLPVRNLNYQIYIQKASLVVTTYVASVITLQGHTTGRVYGTFNIPAASPSTASNADYVLDYGPQGTPVVLGESVDVLMTPIGAVGILHVEAYQKLGKTIGSNDSSVNQ
jgi:hypothetical protein